jgi:hypothetical protein
MTLKIAKLEHSEYVFVSSSEYAKPLLLVIWGSIFALVTVFLE